MLPLGLRNHTRITVGHNDETPAGIGDARDVVRIAHSAGADEHVIAQIFDQSRDAIERLRRVQRHLDDTKTLRD